MGRGLTKASIARATKEGASNIFKRAWQIQKGGKKTTGKRKSPPKKRSYVSRAKGAGRRISRMNPPIEMLIALGVIPFTNSRPGFPSPFESAMNKNWQAVANDVKQGFLGMDETGRIDLLGALNPFDFDHAKYSKMLTAAGILGYVRKKMPWAKVQSALYRKIPFVGRRIS